MRSNTIPDFRDITVDFVTIYLWALYCPDSRSWLARANSLILPEACQDSEARGVAVRASWSVSNSSDHLVFRHLGIMTSLDVGSDCLPVLAKSENRDNTTPTGRW